MMIDTSYINKGWNNNINDLYHPDLIEELEEVFHDAYDYHISSMISIPRK